MLEWLKRHAWKACVRQKRTAGSNPACSARNFKYGWQPRMICGVVWQLAKEDKPSLLENRVFVRLPNKTFRGTRKVAIHI